MRTVEYHYPRALELEGRRPADAGCWPQTELRLKVGEGLPYPDSSWALVTYSEGQPIPHHVAHRRHSCGENSIAAHLIESPVK